VALERSHKAEGVRDENPEKREGGGIGNFLKGKRLENERQLTRRAGLGAIKRRQKAFQRQEGESTVQALE